jgi:hypothetical protein
MRARPIRSQIYLPVTVFGVVSSDWKYVLVAGLAGYTVPYILDLRLWKVPLELITSVVAMAATIAFLNLIRVGKRPHWLQHHVKAMVEPSCHRRRLPADKSVPNNSWLRDTSTES